MGSWCCIFGSIINQLQLATKSLPDPMVPVLIREFGRDPFIVLISCLLSLRAKDTITLPICRKLFSQARTPDELLGISIAELENLIRPIGFYRKKAQLLHEVCHELIKRFEGKVPDNELALLSINGVGRKTAALVLGQAFGVPAICVDTHVHRIANRFGIVTTKTPVQTELALQKILPKEYWIEFNTLLIKWGQNICKPRCRNCAHFIR